MVPASKIITAQEARSGLMRVTTQVQNKRKFYTVSQAQAQTGKGTTSEFSKLLFKTFKRDNFHDF